MASTTRIAAIAALLLFVSTEAGARGKPVPPAARAHFKQGRAYQEAGAWADAVKEYEKAFALAPLPELQYNIGQCQRLANDKPKAIMAYQRYLDLAPEGPLAEEARNHIASLRLKIQVEEAELARRQAQEEAEAARKQARELAEAKARAEAEAARRLKAEIESRERLQKLAAEEAQRLERRREQQEWERRRRVERARSEGKALRSGGIAAMVVGSLALATAAFGGALLSELVKNMQAWDDSSPDLNTIYWDREQDYRLQFTLRDSIVGVGVTGGVLLVGGIILYRLGIRQRDRAMEAADRPVTVMPVPGPGGLGLALQGRFR